MMKIRTIVLVIICLTGFIYQMKILVDDYLSGSTVVTLTVGPNDDTLPGLTFCTFDYYMFEKLQRNSAFAKSFSDYRKELSKLNVPRNLITDKLNNFIKSYVENLNIFNESALDILKKSSIERVRNPGYHGFRIFILGVLKNIEKGTEQDINSLNTPRLLPIP